MESKRKRSQADTEAEGKKSYKKSRSAAVIAPPPATPSIPDDSMSTTIAQALEQLEPEIFHELMTTILLPAAETALNIEMKETVTLAFQNSLEKHGDKKKNTRLIKLIDFDRYERRLMSRLGELEAACEEEGGVMKDDWETKMEDQMEILGEILTEAQEWCKNLVEVTIVLRAQLPLVHKSLKFIATTLDKCNSTCE